MALEDSIIQWLENNPGQKWVDNDFPCNSAQFYENAASIPEWGTTLKNIEWKRPEEIVKDPKFMIVEEIGNTKTI